MAGSKCRQEPSRRHDRGDHDAVAGDDPQQAAHRLVGAFERVGQGTTEGDDGVELAVAVARRVAQVEQRAALHAALGVAAAQVLGVERELDLGDVADDDRRSDRRELEGEAARAAAPTSSTRIPRRTKRRRNRRCSSRLTRPRRLRSRRSHSASPSAS